MKVLFYTAAVELITIWFFGFFVYHAGYLIHILLIIAVAAILVRAFRTRWS